MWWYTISIVIDNEISGWLSLKPSNSRAEKKTQQQINKQTKQIKSKQIADADIHKIHSCYKYKLFATYDAPFVPSKWAQKWWKKTHIGRDLYASYATTKRHYKQHICLVDAMRYTMMMLMWSFAANWRFSEPKMRENANSHKHTSIHTDVIAIPFHWSTLSMISSNNQYTFCFIRSTPEKKTRKNIQFH